MSILEDLKTSLSGCGIPFRTGFWGENAPDRYIVITPLDDDLELYGDDDPEGIIESARLSLFSKGNYIAEKYRLINLLNREDYTITYISYIGYETDTKYHHLVIEVEKYYEREES